MKPKVSYLTIISFLLIVHQVHAQYFGRNKPQYERFDFRVKESPHIVLYHYMDDDSVSDGIVNDAEYWYARHQRIFNDTITFKNPVIMYNNHTDFQQTTTISGSIGVGTGGVTEALRTRVIMPMMNFNQETHHVLGHEMVHVFQYRMMKNQYDSGVSLAAIQNIPLWMVEGLAEYLSIGNVHPPTAMWMRDAVREEDIPTLRDLSRSNKYFPYRYGHAFWAYMAGHFGDSVIRPMFRKTAISGYDDAVKAFTGLDEEKFSEAWGTRLKEYYVQFRPDGDLSDSLAGNQIISEKNAGSINISPVLSPNGQFVAFLSEKNIFSIDLILADAHTGEILKTLSSATWNSHVDDLSYLESAGTWSPSGDRIAYVAIGKGKTLLSFVDVNSRREISTVEIPGLESFTNPAWSPDGSYIAVAGTTDGKSDLYLFNIRTQEVTRLTNDYYSEIQPQWSPDGTYLVFSSDRPASGRKYQLNAIQLSMLNIRTGEIKVLDIFPGAANLNPVFAADGTSLYFLSDRDGFRNLYNYNLESGVVSQLTDFFTGISGVTAYTPAVSVSAKTDDVVYTYYRNKNYEIFRAKPDEFLWRQVDPMNVDLAAGTLPPAERTGQLPQPGYDSLLLKRENIAVTSSPYRPKFRLEYIGNNVGIGVSTGGIMGTQAGMAGGVDIMFSDILAYNRLLATISINGQVYDFGGQVAYLNQKNQLNWGVLVGHIPYRSAFMTIAPDTVSVDGDVYQVDRISVDIQRAFEENLSVFFSYPLSTTRRFELGTGYSRYSFRVDRLNYYYYQGVPVGISEDKNLEAPDAYQIGNTYGAYVVDNSFFGLASPMRGLSYRLEIQSMYDALNFQTITADFRKYVFLNPSAIAFRIMHIGRYGNDAESGRIYPLSFAYPTLTRGNSLDEIDRYNTDDRYTINQIFGSRMLVGNVEWRLPFTGPEQLALIKSGILFSELALFLDSGVAWTSDTKPGFTWDASGNTRIPFFSVGLSGRLNVFGQIVLEPYYAFPWRASGFARGQFGVNLSPGW